MPFERSYYPNYYSIQDILATQEKVPCKFNVELPRLGFLNPSSETNDLQAGVKLQLPIWLIENIVFGRSANATAEIPRIYRETYREILKADAAAVDLNNLSINFYEFGKHVAKFDDTGEVSDILLEVFKSRFRQLMDISNNSGVDSIIVNKLDALERMMYSSSHRAYLKLEQWLVETTAPMQAAEMVINHKKRKRAELEKNEND